MLDSRGCGVRMSSQEALDPVSCLPGAYTQHWVRTGVGCLLTGAEEILSFLLLVPSEKDYSSNESRSCHAQVFWH